MEWIFAGGLPKGSRSAASARMPAEGKPSEAGGDTEARLEKAAERVVKERRAEEEALQRRERERKEAAAQEAAARARASLASEEAALREHTGVLQRELPSAEQEEDAPAASLAERLRRGVAKTRERLAGGLGRVVMGKKEIDRDTLEDLEEVLLTADMGPQTATRLIKALEAKMRRDELKDPERLKAALEEEVRAVMARTYDPLRMEGGAPTVVLFAGVNGSGKTTTIGKLGAQFRRNGRKVLLAAGDTFRAAAAEQLTGWAERSGCDIFRAEEGANPSGVIYQAVEKALKEGYDMVLCDTAGRLHTKTNLMEELKKIKRVIGKLVEDAPQETLLVVDANNGQNAIHQTREFHEAIGLSGLVVTKLDGTARGGVLVGIVNEFELPVRYVGIGEGVDDLRPFEPEAFAASLFE